MYALVDISESPDAYDNLCRFLARGQATAPAPPLVTLTEDGNVVYMDAAEDFYRELLPKQPEMHGMAIRSWDSLSPAEQEAFAADLGRHSEWLFPDTGRLYYLPADDILDIITAP